MPKQKISEFNSNPALNTDIDSINLAEGCAPSGINDAIRELMSQLKDWQSGTSNDPYVVGSSGSLTLNQGTANGVAYLNGSKVVTSGSALTFDGTKQTIASSASASPVELLRLSNTGSGDLTQAQITFYAAGTNYAVITGGYNGAPSLISNVAAGGYQSWQIATNEKMRLDASGNLGIGTSSPARKLVVSNAGAQGFEVGPGGGLGSGNEFLNYNRSTSLYVPSVNYSSSYIFHVGTGGNIRAVDIDSSGNLLVGTTSATAGGVTVRTHIAGNEYGLGISVPSSGAQQNIRFVNGTTAVGSVTTSGSATAYNTSSDQRLKQNIQNADSASTLIDSLQVRKFDWKADGSHQRYGFVAQELVTVAPEAVHQPEDTNEMMAVDYSKLVPMLVKEVQSLRARVAQLESN